MTRTRGIRRRILSGHGVVSCVCVLTGILATFPLPVVAGYRPLPRVRQPVALALIDDAATLLVANFKSGTITEINTKSASIIAEHPVGGRLTDLASVGETLFAVDNAAAQLLILSHSPNGLRQLGQLPLPHDPLHLAVSASGGVVAVTCRWSKSVVIAQTKNPLGQPSSPEFLISEVSLPFSPRCVILSEQRQKLFVADAFGSGFAVLDLPTQSIEAVHEIAGHNLAGLAFDAAQRQLFVSHQHLNRLARTRHDDVFWGTVISNVLESYSISQLAAGLQKRLYTAETIFLGDPNHGSGDPGAIAITPSDKRIVALAGIGELAFKEGKQPLRFLPVGDRPVDLQLHPDGVTLYVANCHSDTVSIVDTEREEVLATIALGPEVALTIAEQGERAFFDARLSLSGWYSCHSCHTDGHTNGGAADTAGDGSFGAPKQIPSLRGVGDTAPWGWLGNVEDLQEQVQRSIVSTMQGAEPSAELSAAITQYLQTLETVPSQSKQVVDAQLIAEGRALFESSGCARCHVPPTYTSEATFNVDIADELANSRFNPPSLRGVRHRGPYLHDGRALTLEAVFRDHGHRLPGPLTEEQLEQLVAFLENL